ncbi:DNA-processing protein DprA [Brenneria populi]|uniref:DNA-processing protein DprA n=1 Tax=Brenneria populi TaxID=1505588 RepID=A0ABU6JR08_9GAMM|nr:DNA-processing protein DprA [Brenneria populi Li et al. 2015]
MKSLVTWRVKMTDTEQARWNTESAALLALSSIRGVSYWSLYKVAQNGIRFRDIITANTFQKFEDLLGVRLNKTFFNISETTWPEFRNSMIDAAKSLLINYHAQGFSIIHHGSPSYPEKLKELTNPPYWLFTQGDMSLLAKKCVGVVGTREPSKLATFLTQSVISNFINLDYSIVSGLAFGIDQIAHESALMFKVPTIAVLGTGIYSNYPKNSEAIRNDIVSKGGLIVTEYLPDQKPSKENFVRRNRIQAAISDILIPVEWNIKSGTAHTVKSASELKRKILCPVFGDMAENEEIKFAQSNYGAVLLKTPLTNDKEFEKILNSPSLNTLQQLTFF